MLRHCKRSAGRNQGKNKKKGPQATPMAVFCTVKACVSCLVQLNRIISITSPENPAVLMHPVSFSCTQRIFVKFCSITCSNDPSPAADPYCPVNHPAPLPRRSAAKIRSLPRFIGDPSCRVNYTSLWFAGKPIPGFRITIYY